MADLSGHRRAVVTARGLMPGDIVLFDWCHYEDLADRMRSVRATLCDGEAIVIGQVSPADIAGKRWHYIIGSMPSHHGNSTGMVWIPAGERVIRYRRA